MFSSPCAPPVPSLPSIDLGFSFIAGKSANSALSVNSALDFLLFLSAESCTSHAQKHGRKPSNPFRIRTFAKCVHNFFRIRTFKTQGLKSFRIRIYRKSGGGGVLLLTRNPTIEDSDPAERIPVPSDHRERGIFVHALERISILSHQPEFGYVEWNPAFCIAVCASGFFINVSQTRPVR